jgi:hypothetical protein
MRYVIATRKNNEQRIGWVRPGEELYGKLFVLYAGTYDEFAEWLPKDKVRFVGAKELAKFYRDQKKAQS